MEDYLNEETFDGEYYDGKRKGIGKLIKKKTGETFEGMWEEDMKNGPGTMTSDISN